MKTILKLLLTAMVLSLVPATYVCAQGHIETPAERRLGRNVRLRRSGSIALRSGPWQVIIVKILLGLWMPTASLVILTNRKDYRVTNKN